MVIHFHYSVFPYSGEIRRIQNINTNLAFRLSNKVIEIEFFNPSKFNYIKHSGKFLLNSKIKHKYYAPMIPKYECCSLLRCLNSFWTSLFTGLICLMHKPTHIIGEYSTAYKSMKLVKLFSPSTKLIIDIHGAAPEEYEYYTNDNKSRKYKSLTADERKSISNANYIICQSEEMKRHIVSKYAADEKKITVYKCGVDTNMFFINSKKRIEIRKELGIPDDCMLFAYSGGLHKWQKVEDSINVFYKFHKQYPNSRLLILTKDLDQLQLLLGSKQEIADAVISKSLPFNLVPDYLNAADIAFLLRDNVIMNAVASPTKLAEYMACGLPIITTEVAKKWVTPKAYKYLIFANENLSNQDIIDIVSHINRNDIQQYAKEELSLTIDNQTIKDFLNTHKK